MLREVLLTIKFLSSMQKLFFSKNYFFPVVITEWNNVDTSIRNSSSCHIFKNLTLKFIRPEPYIISSTQNFEGLRLLDWFESFSRSQIQTQFSRLLKYYLWLWSGDRNIKSFLSSLSRLFFEKINLIGSNILQQNDLSTTKNLIFGYEKLKGDKNNALLTPKIELIQSTERFKYPLFQ